MRIIRFLFSMLLWLVFWNVAFISIVISLLLSLILPRHCYNAIVRVVCRTLSTSVLLFPKVTRRPENIPYPCVYVGNHVSFFDLFICGSVLPGNPRGMELRSHFRTPIYGWFISRFGEIPVDRGNTAALRQSFRNAADILTRGDRSILVMPEGTRSRSGDIGKFGGGAFYLARTAGVSIVPVIFDNLFEHNNAKSLDIRPGRVNVRILDPIRPETFQSEDALRDYVRDVMIADLADRRRTDD